MRIALLIGANGNVVGPNVRVPAGIWDIKAEGQKDSGSLAISDPRTLDGTRLVLENPDTIQLTVQGANNFSAYVEGVK